MHEQELVRATAAKASRTPPTPVARSAGQGSPEAGLLELQRSIGNAALTRLLATSEPVAVQRAPLGVRGPGGTMLDSEDTPENKLAIQGYILSALERGDDQAVEVMLQRLHERSPALAAYHRNLAEAHRAGAGAGGAGGAGEERPKIPRLVHFVWVGNRISEAAWRNVQAWAQRAQNTDWRICIWTDKKTTWSWGQHAAFLSGTVSRMYIEDALDQRLTESYAKALRGGAYPAASDMARYCILKKHGGVYADVDLGVGTVVLDRANRLGTRDVPVFGPQLRDEQSLGDLTGPANGRSRRERIRAAVDRLYNDAAYGNHFLIAQKESTFLERMIDEVAARLADMGPEDMKTGAAPLTGPYAVWRVLVRHIDEEFGVSNVSPDERRLFQGQMTEHFRNNVEWLTSESENQEYEGRRAAA